MNTVLILYPQIFKSKSKFDRKVSNILKNMQSFNVVYLNDANGFVTALSEMHDQIESIDKIESVESVGVTHAIVFDDGEVFPVETNKLKDAGVKVRKLKVDITRVINIKVEKDYAAEKSTPGYEYIGRGSYWGNPYSMFEEGESRDEVIRKYKYDFEFEKFPNKEKSEVFKLTGKRLGCFCKPEACHGDVLADFLNAFDDGL